MSKKTNTVNDSDYLSMTARIIEMNLEAFGLYVKVVQTNKLDMFDEYYLDVSVGTSLDKLEKRGRELALALASPTGKIYWEIPVPGTSLVKLIVPKQIEKANRWNMGTVRNKIAFVFFLVAKLNYYISYKILGKL